VRLTGAAGDSLATARALINLAHQILKYDADPDAAEEHFNRARTIAEQSNDRVLVAMCGSHFGDVARARGDFTGARAAYENALAALRDLGDRFAAMLTLIDLGELLSDYGESQKGHDALVEAVDLARVLGNRPGIARILEVFARRAASRAEDERAVRLAGAAAGIRQRLGDVSDHFPSVDDLKRMGALDAARRAIGEASRSADREGRSMSLEQAIEQALNERMD
jgi:ATP/maltotriose-dependent transcriptional regulator MalT